MTTIIVVVVVALVFFVAVCVVTFMIWKRESEMRTDSIRAIEQNLERLTSELSADSPPHEQRAFNDGRNSTVESSYMDSVIAESIPMRSGKKRSYDPFGWVRDEEVEPTVQIPENRRSVEETEAVKENAPDEIFVSRLPEGEEMEAPPLYKDTESVVTYNEMKHNQGTLSDDEAWEPEEVQTEDENIEIQQGTSECTAQETADTGEEANHTENPEEFRDTELSGEPAEISFDFMEKLQQPLRQYEEEKTDMGNRQQMGYDVGRSGRKYTATELETLIKE